MYFSHGKTLLENIQAILGQKYQTKIDTLALELPPKIEYGEYALPIAFELAKQFKKAPRKIAEEIVAELSSRRVDGFASFQVAGAGYINCKLDRGSASRDLAKNAEERPAITFFPLIEHTSINPNKAAHIGHLRNAILGDTLARMMRVGGNGKNILGVQNYIDNTGVQVADVVVALTHPELEGMDLAGVEHWMETLRQRGERIDFVCWDLYARVGQWYEEDPEQKEARKQARLDTLHKLEEGGNAISAIAELVSTAIVRRHLETMERLGIEYDFLPRESEVLHLRFWDAAFELMKAKGVLYKETAGKNAGCWVMRRPGTEGGTGNGPDEEAKVIVRSNGTVTYVGKDIAYHLWKFGKLDKLDFYKKEFYPYPGDKKCFISCLPDPSNLQIEPSYFGKADAVYNVIDSRQTDPQNNVIEALRGMGLTREADYYHHFSYEMVALTPRCAEELGHALSDEDRARPFIEVSGRKGSGVKADDLIDKMEGAALAEVTQRHPELEEAKRRSIASQIAVGALRYYMLRYTRNTIIAFDFKDALSFEGETGPYAQYAAVRAANILRKAGKTQDKALAEYANAAISVDMDDSVWAVWLAASRSIYVLEQSIRALEPAYLAKYVFQLAQQFNNFYHQHPVLTEDDPARKRLLLATVAVALRELKRSLGWLGISAPEMM